MTIRKAAQQFIVLLLIPISPLACAQQKGANKRGAKVLNDYSSPQAVFESAREARRQRDWRRCFACLTPAAQKDALFESFFACAESGTEEGREIIATYIDDAAKFKADMDKKDEAQQRSAGKARADNPGTNEPRQEGGSSDRDVLSDALFDHIKDKAGFYAAASDLIEGKVPSSVLGPFEGLAVDGDRAEGRAKVKSWSLLRSPGQPPKKIEDESYKTFKFRRIEGKWLID
jgi:hypothetical protein